jgi:hypothetical protein
MVERQPIKPMTITSAQKMGLLGIELVCQPCGRSGYKSFDALDLPVGTPIPAIARSRKFLCSACGGRAIISLPDWSNYRPPGMGGFNPPSIPSPSSPDDDGGGGMTSAGDDLAIPPSTAEG